MSFPEIPDVSPNINISIDAVINLLLASIAFEEFGLAHLINAESEKIQSVLGTLDNQTIRSPSVDELVRVDKTVSKILRDIIKKEMLLQFKLDDVLEIPAITTSSSSTTTTASTTTTSTTSTGTTTTGLCGCNLITENTEIGLEDVVLGIVNNSQDQFNGDIAALLASICTDCQNPANSSLLYAILDDQTQDLLYILVPDTATITVECPQPETIIVSGSGEVSTAAETSPALFVLTATEVDNAPDTFQMIINATNDTLDHNSGIVEAALGSIIVDSCNGSSPGATALFKNIDFNNLPKIKLPVKE